MLPNPLGLVAVPAEVANALKGIGLLVERIGEVATATGVLPGMAAAIEQVNRRLGDVAENTSELHPLRENIEAVRGDLHPLQVLVDEMGEVAKATAPLPQVQGDIARMDGRMATIEDAMPVLVEVQKTLVTLPQTMETLGTGLTQMSALLEQLLASLGRLDENVSSLQDAVEPLGRVADRLPGGKKR
jgi:uncharacterized phage infection (PIP) family protein YhgE